MIKVWYKPQSNFSSPMFLSLLQGHCTVDFS